MAKIDKGGVAWEAVIKTIDYLVKRGSDDKYITDSFYNQIGMTENDFDKLWVKNGYSDAWELYDEREAGYSNKIEAPEEDVKEPTIEKEEPCLKLTPYLRTNENGEELHQIKSLKDMEIGGVIVPEGSHGGWVSSLDSVGDNSWFTKDVEVWDGVKIEPNTYLDTKMKIKDNSDITVAQAMTRNSKSREANKTGKQQSAKQSI